MVYELHHISSNMSSHAVQVCCSSDDILIDYVPQLKRDSSNGISVRVWWFLCPAPYDWRNIMFPGRPSVILSFRPYRREYNLGVQYIFKNTIFIV